METPGAKEKQLKEQIAEILDMKPDLLLYELNEKSAREFVLNLTTISPNRHHTKFLFHSSVGSSPQEALMKMYEYVTTHMKNQDTFQIRWHNPKTKEVEISWFRASNIIEALDKFFYDGKEVGDYKIYEVTLQPYA
jgi:hypothetical protein